MSVSSVRVQCAGKSYTVSFRDGETLLSALRSAGFSVPAACGGRGKCGKCRVAVNGVPRLACKTMPCDGDEITLPEAAGGTILTQTLAVPRPAEAEAGCAAAVDLGTTTVAVRLYDLESGRELATLSAWSAQAAYGADVISRIQHTIDFPDGLSELSGLIRRQTEQLILQALHDSSRSTAELKRIFLAGNTVMQHIFAQLPVRSIAIAPFKPLSLFDGESRDELLGAKIIYAPCVAGYVGGDITAGLLASGLCGSSGENLFLDIGTNGEMALGGRDGFLCCAVASGPAFEGAGISCGMAALKGAVSHVRYDKGFLFDVIGGGEPRGICGSGLLDLAAVLLTLGCIDEGGRLLPPDEVPESMRKYVSDDGSGNGIFHLAPDVHLTAGDVRALQLAKSAVCAGIKLMLQRRGIEPEQLGGVCIAGGFGNYIDPASAMDIGMLPRVSPEKLRCLGNTSLAGASMAALDPKKLVQLRETAKMCDYIELSGRSDFTQLFTENMAF